MMIIVMMTMMIYDDDDDSDGDDGSSDNDDNDDKAVADVLLFFLQPNVRAAAFTWNGRNKSKGSFFLGSSPEFDLAVYSVCAMMYPNSLCNFSLKVG